MGFDNDLTGNKVKGYTVIGFAGNDSRRKSLWSCQCDKCHAIKVFRGDSILREEIAVCECKRTKANELIDMTGRRFGDWLVLQKAKSSKKGAKWLCQCDCGTKQEIYGSILRAGNSKSCRECACRKRRNKSTGNSQACAEAKVLRGGEHYAGDKPPMAERAQAIRNREMALSGALVEVHDSSKQAAGKANGRKHGHYFKDVENLKQIDVYMVFRLFETQDHEIEHAIKKLLAAGRRGYKDRRKDVLEAIDTLNRWVEIEDELSQTNGGQ